VVRPLLRRFSLMTVWRVLAFGSAVLAIWWLFISCDAISSAKGTAIRRTLILGRSLIGYPKIILNGDFSALFLGAALIAGSFRPNSVLGSQVDYLYSLLCLFIGLVMVSGSHVKVNHNVCHQLRVEM